MLPTPASIACARRWKWSRSRASAGNTGGGQAPIANGLQVFFKDGTHTAQVVVEYPIGHRRRRGEGIPLLEAKFRENLATRFVRQRCDEIFALCKDQARLEGTAVQRFVDLFVM